MISVMFIMLQFSAGWDPLGTLAWSCWKTAQVFFHHSLHARCTALAAYLSADAVSYHCNGLPLCPSLRPLLPLQLLQLPSVGFGSSSGAAFCCEVMSLWRLGPI